MEIGSVLARLYRSEINAGIESFWDDGFQVWLGHGDQPVPELHTHSLEQAAAWLDEQARRHWPESEYAHSSETGSAEESG